MGCDLQYFTRWRHYRSQIWNVENGFAFEAAHRQESNLHRAPSETLPAAGAGRRSCYAIRLDSELMGLSPRLPFPFCTYLLTVSVWKAKAVSLSPHLSWWWRISADKVAQSHCWVCWGLSMPGPVLCHHKSLLKIYGYYLSPVSACVRSDKL